MTTRSSSSTTTTTTRNGKFIGGAAAARNKAMQRPLSLSSAAAAAATTTTTRRATGTPILNPLQRQRVAQFTSQVLSIKLNPMERFFASIFRSSVLQLLDSHRSTTARTKLLQQMTHRVGLTPPCKLEQQQHYKAHAAALASLVLEEARFIVAEALSTLMMVVQPLSAAGTVTTMNHAKNNNNNNTNTNTNNSIQVTLSSTKGITPHDVLFFRKATDFTIIELQSIRPGTVFVIQREAKKNCYNTNSMLLGTIVTMTEQRSLEFDLDITMNTALRSISLMIYQDQKVTSGDYVITPLTTLLTQVRQFEACTMGNYSVPFLPALMGQKGATHTKFELYDEFKETQQDNEMESKAQGNDFSSFDSDDDVKIKPEPKCVSSANDDEDDSSINNYASSSTPVCNIGDAVEIFSIPTLDETQEKACLAFLNSKPASITLVQGPPGTGSYRHVLC